MAAPGVRWRVVFAAAVVAATAVLGGGAAADGQDDPGGEIPQDRPTAHVEQTLKLSFFEGSEDLRISIFVQYPARTEAEADAARDGTLDPEWFRPRDRVEAVVANRGGDVDALQDGLLSPSHSETAFGREPRAPEHGWVTLAYYTGWNDFVDDGTDIRIGRAFVDRFGEDWLIEVAYPAEWEPDRLAGTPDTSQAGPQGLSQTWNLSDDPEPPLIVFERSSEQDDDSSPIPLGSAGGVGPAALALLIVVLGATALRLRTVGRKQ